MIFQGTVKEVRTFSKFVTLFITVASPAKYRCKVVKFTLDNDTCQHLLKWAQLEEGDQVAITRTQNSGIPRNRTYELKVLESQSIDVDDIEQE